MCRICLQKPKACKWNALRKQSTSLINRLPEVEACAASYCCNKSLDSLFASQSTIFLALLGGSCQGIRAIAPMYCALYFISRSICSCTLVPLFSKCLQPCQLQCTHCIRRADINQYCVDGSIVHRKCRVMFPASGPQECFLLLTSAR
jgi:hypothetical protein